MSDHRDGSAGGAPFDPDAAGGSPAQTLWVTDAELIRRMGVPEKIARLTIKELDEKHKETGFPQKNAIWGDRRYWPAVKEWLDATNRPKMGAIPLRRAS